MQQQELPGAYTIRHPQIDLNVLMQSNSLCIPQSYMQNDEIEIKKRIKIECDYKNWFAINTYYLRKIPAFPKNRGFKPHEINALKNCPQIRVITHNGKTHFYEILGNDENVHMKELDVKKFEFAVKHSFCCKMNLENYTTECHECASFNFATCTALELYEHIIGHLKWIRHDICVDKNINEYIAISLLEQYYYNIYEYMIKENQKYKFGKRRFYQNFEKVDVEITTISELEEKIRTEYEFENWIVDLVARSMSYYDITKNINIPLPQIPKNYRHTIDELDILEKYHKCIVVVRDKRKYYYDSSKMISSCKNCVEKNCVIHMIQLEEIAVEINHYLSCDYDKFKQKKTECSICGNFNPKTCTYLQMYNHLFDHLHMKQFTEPNFAVITNRDAYDYLHEFCEKEFNFMMNARQTE